MKEKRKSVNRDENYYISIVEKVGKKTFDTNEMYQIILKNDKEFGGYSPHFKSIVSKILLKLEQMLRKNLERVETDIVARSNNKSMICLYSIKDIEIAKNSIRKFFKEEKFPSSLDNLPGILKKLREEDEIPERVILKPKKEIEISVAIKGRKKHRNVRKRTLDNIIKVVVETIKSGKDSIQYQKIAELTESTIFNVRILSAWEDALKQLKILSAFSVHTESKWKVVKINNPRELLINLAMEYKNRFGIELDIPELPRVKSLSKVEIRKVEINTTPITTIKEDDDVNSKSNGDILYYIGGILQSYSKNGTKSLSTEMIVTILRKEFAVSITKKECISLIKSEIDIEELMHGESLRLRDIFSWTRLKEKYNPSNTKMNALVLLSMDEVELRKFEISFNTIQDGLKTESGLSIGIYELNLDRSKNCLKKLIKLYRSFRGEDKFLNSKDLEAQIKIEIAKIDGEIYNEILSYQIEKL